MAVKQPFLNFNTSELLERQANLQNQAKDVLDNLNLLAILEQAGEPHIVGSVDLKLMVWPDIDIQVQTPAIPDIDAIMTCAKQLLISPGVNRLTMADNRQGSSPNVPPGVYLGPDYHHQSGKWQIDIWFIQKQEAMSQQAFIQNLKSKMTSDDRLIILQLKQILAANPQYHKTIFSVDIYQAVLNHGVKTIDQFEIYLQRTGRNL